MATFIVSNIGGNYNVGTTWIGGVAPSATDDIGFTNTSGDLNITVGSVCGGINFTNYIGLITFSSQLTVNGDINLGTGGYSTTGAGRIQANSSGTLTSNGVVWNSLIAFGGTNQVYTLADDWNINSELILGGTSLVTINGYNFYCTSLTMSSNAVINGSTNIVFNGTGTWLHLVNGIIYNNITINTTGTLTIYTARFGTGALVYISGIVVNLGALVLYGSSTLDTNGIIWNQVYIVSTGIITNNSTLTIDGSFTIGSGTVKTTINGSDVLIKGNFVYSSISDSGTGSSTFIFAGTGTWLSSGYLAHNVVINTIGTLTLSGNIYYFGGTFTYTAGTVITTSSTFFLGVGTILNCAGIIFNKIQFNISSTTITLLDDIYLTGEFRIAGSVTGTINGFSIYCGGSVYIVPDSYVAKGTTTLVLIGSGTWTHQSSSSISLPLTINTTGTYTFSGSGLKYGGSGSMFTYIKGTLINPKLALAGSSIIDSGLMVWDSFTNTASATVTLLSNFNVNGDFLINVNSLVINNFNIYVGGNLTRTTSGVFNGTSNLFLIGTGTWSDIYRSSVWTIPVTINTSGVITINDIRCPLVLKYISGTVVAVGTLNFYTSVLLDNTQDISWDSITIAAGGNISGSGIKCNNLLVNSNFNLEAGSTSIINNSLICIGTSAAPRTIGSIVPGIQANLILNNTGDQDVAHTNGRDINSNGGTTIYSYRVVSIINCDNWSTLPIITSINTNTILR